MSGPDRLGGKMLDAKRIRVLLGLARRWRTRWSQEELKLLHSEPEQHFRAVLKLVNTGELATAREIWGALRLLHRVRQPETTPELLRLLEEVRETTTDEKLADYCEALLYSLRQQAGEADMSQD
jgi:hypothetical protein